MTEEPAWTAMEAAIADLLPSGDSASPDRIRLLAAISRYAETAVRQARRLGPMAPTAEARARALEWLATPVFLCGHHRTGTTLLHNLLDGHPALRVLPSEGTYLTSHAYAARRDAQPAAADRFAADWIARLVDPNAGPHFLLGRRGSGEHAAVAFARRLFGWQHALRQAWPEREPFALLLALVAAFGDVVTPLDQPRLWVEKTPLNERYAARLALAFPRARFIQLVREPRATLASLIEVYRGVEPAPRPIAHARSIRRSFRLARRNQRRFPSRYIVIRYEDLTGQPAATMQEVCAFLGITGNPGLATPTVLGQPVCSNSAFRPAEAGVLVAPRPPPAIDSRAVDLLRALAGSSAHLYGYDLSPLPIVQRVKVLLREVPRYVLDRARARL
jgi:hypothetical protein